MGYKAIKLPYELFLTRDSQGNYHWYKSDPLKLKNRSESEVQVEDAITEIVGWGNAANPVAVSIHCAKINRSEEFNTALLTGIRKGTEDKHIEDMSGSVVDLAVYQNANKEYPLSGIVFSREGEPVTMRLYNFKGECIDGDPDHKLIVMNGDAVFVAAGE